MELYRSKALVLAKIEAVSGQDENPDGTNALLVTDLDIKPAEGDKLKRDFITPDLSTQPHIITRKHQSVSFKLELKGGGAAGSVPEYGPILRAAGFSETIDPGVDVTYQPVSSGFESASIYVNIDGILHKLVGCRGNTKFDFTSGKFPVFEFNGMALEDTPTDTAQVTPTYGAVAPLEVNKANTTFTFGGFAAVLHSLMCDMGWKTKFRSLVNLDAAVSLTERECTGSMVIDAVKAADHDYWADWRNSSQIALTLTHGTVAGNIVDVAAAKVQLDTIDYGDDENILTKNMPLTYTRGSGDDEVILTVK